MIRRIIAAVLIVLGLGTVGAAIASATAWKPDTTVTVPLPAQPTVNYVITDPGVLNIVNETVKVRAVADDPESPVFLAMGRTDEIEAWVAPSDHGKITGLETWEELSYTTVTGVEPEADDEDDEAEEGEEEEDTDANPADSDMWVEEVNGIGEAAYTWQEIPGQWSMIVATDGSTPAPMVELTWEREVPTPALIPGIIVGSLLTVIGLALLIWALIKRQRDDTDEEELEVETLEEEEAQASPEDIMAAVESQALAEADLPETGAVPYQDASSGELDESYPHELVTGDHAGDSQDADPDQPEVPLTRRQIRERERQRERTATLESPSGADEAPQQWPTQEPGALPEEGPEPPKRRWWQRKESHPTAPATGPIMIDDDTGEIIITGEIDVSNLTPQARGDSWRATWGLDKDTPTRWIPVVKTHEETEGDTDE